MNAKRLSTVIAFALLVLLLSACATKARTQVVEKTENDKPKVVVTQVVKQTSVVTVKETSVVRVVETKEVAVRETVFVAPTQAPLAVQPKLVYPTATPAPQATMAVPGSVPTPVDNYFQDYGVNPFLDTAYDHLSTFAVDVDTASYSVMRNYIADGNLPPADAVRVEEFVNYFDQGYPNTDGTAFAIYADGALSPFTNDGTYIVRIGIQGYRVPEEARKPLVLTFVIDVSGSMASEGRLDLVKDSLELLVDRLRWDDTVGIVAYTTDAYKVLDPVSGDQHGKILKAIYSLSPQDTTNAEAGLRMGYKMAMQAYREDAINRVILCSDGVANVGNVDPNVILSEVRGYVEEGVTLTTIGVGMGNFNDVLLEQLADNGNGNYHYVDTLDEAQKVLVDDLVSNLQVIALDAKVQVDFNADVVARYRLIGYENRAVADSDFRNDQVDAGEIGAGHTVTALYAVQFRSGEGRIATVQLRWQDPDTREIVEINGNFNTWDLSSSFRSTSAYYQLDVIVAQFAEILRDSPYAYHMSLSALTEYAYSLPGLIPDDPDVAEFVDLVYNASKIRR